MGYNLSIFKKTCPLNYRLYPVWVQVFKGFISVVISEIWRVFVGSSLLDSSFTHSLFRCAGEQVADLTLGADERD